MPKLQDSPETYAPRLVIDDEMYYATAPLQVIKPRKVQHKMCQCLVMWKHSEFMLEYLKYYPDVYIISHTIMLAQDSETMASLKWLQTLYSIELILWPHLYILMSMTSYCTFLAQQQCDWVAQWDVDEFLYLLDNARLFDFVKGVPAMPTRCCLSSISCRCLPTRLFFARLAVCCATIGAVLTA